MLQAAVVTSVVFIALVINQSGSLLTGSLATNVACLAMLVFGLPHGSLDIALIRLRLRLNSANTLQVILAYAALAAMMLVLWNFAPVTALGVFFIVSCGHFSHDWSESMEPVFAWGTACAVLCAPSLLYRGLTGDLFARIAGVPSASILADVMLLVFPSALIAAILGMVISYGRGQQPQAAITATTLIGMIFLPPLIGFAAFFCLAHSPTHFADAKSKLLSGSSYKPLEALLYTIAALGIAGLVYGFRSENLSSSGVLAASFVTLSAVTVPHMVIPHFAARWWRDMP